MTEPSEQVTERGAINRYWFRFTAVLSPGTFPPNPRGLTSVYETWGADEVGAVYTVRLTVDRSLVLGEEGEIANAKFKRLLRKTNQGREKPIEFLEG